MSQQSFGRFVQRLTLVLMVGFGTLFVGVTHGDAIPALEAGAPTMYDYWFPRQAAVRQNLFAVYEEDAFSDEFADEMMRENIPMIANALVNAPTGWTYAKVEGVAGLLKFESADPFYDFATDWARWRGKGGKVMPTAILARLERAIPVLGERGYSTFIQFMAYALYCEILANDGQDAASLAAGKRAAELMIEALVEAPADDEFLQRWLNARLLEPIKTQWPDAASAQLVGMLEKAEGINPWHYEMAAGRYFLKRGWDARGTGFASTVSNQGSRDFRSDSIEAGKHLERAHDLEPTYPGAAAMMISVVMGVGSASEHGVRYWFDEAVKHQMDYAPAYTSYESALRPRWSGSYEEMLAFGIECAETEAYLTMVPYNYFDALVQIADDQVWMGKPADAEVVFAGWGSPEVVERVERVLHGLLAATEQATHGIAGLAYERRRKLETALIGFYWKIGKYEKAANVERTIDSFDDDLLRFLNLHGEEILDDRVIWSSQLTAEFAGARHAVEAGDLVSGREAYQAIINAVEEGLAGHELSRPEYRALDDEAREVYRSAKAEWEDLGRVARQRLWPLEIEEPLATGEWTRLGFADEDLLGWRLRKGRAYGSERKGLVLKLDWEKPTIDCLAEVGNRWELRGRVKFPSTRRTENQGNLAIMVRQDQHRRHYNGDSIILNFRRQNVQAYKRLVDVKYSEVDAVIGEEIAFRVLLWDHFLIAYVDEVEVMRIVLPEFEMKARSYGNRLSLGAQSWYPMGNVEVADLELRRLKECPAVMEGFRAGGEE